MIRPYLFLIASVFCTFAQMAVAELPSLSVGEWHGHFAVAESSKFQFSLQTDGNITLFPTTGKRDDKTSGSGISIRPRVEETMPDGSVVSRQIDGKSLESSEAPTVKLEKTTIRGRVTGGTTFEISAEVKQGTIYLSGKIITPGPAVKNPLRFSIEVYFPSAYKGTKVDDEKKSEKFQKKLEDDKITIKWTDGNKMRQTYEESIDASSEKLHGPGIASVEVDAACYYGKKITVTKAPNSLLKISNSNSTPLYKGFSLMCFSDPANIPSSEAQLAIEVR
ncbi:MAG: hypothetical protein RIR37_657 [Verrucomicrobiota bacterium]|jgi:hypothetical protein